MKRELLALEERVAESRVSDTTIESGTRLSKRPDSNGGSFGLVYKRVKRSVQVGVGGLDRSRPNGVQDTRPGPDNGESSVAVLAGVSDDPGMTGGDGRGTSLMVVDETMGVDVKHEVGNATTEGEERGNGVAGVRGGDTAMASCNQRVDDTRDEGGESVNRVDGVSGDRAMETSDDKVGSMGGASLMEVDETGVDVKPEVENTAAMATCDQRGDDARDKDGESVNRVDGVSGDGVVEAIEDDRVGDVGRPLLMEVEEKGGDEKNPLEDDAGVTDLSTDDSRLLANVATNGGEECNVTPKLEAHKLPLVGVDDAVVVNAVNADDGDVEVGNSEGTLAKSQSSKAKRKSKKLSVAQYPRRLTRSSLKSKEATDFAVQLQSEENAELAMSEVKAQVRVEGTLSQAHSWESDEKNLENLPVEKCSVRVTRSSLKPEVDVKDSSLVEACDSVVTDKENTEPLSDGKVESDIDNDVQESILATPKRKMEMKMSKQIALAKIPTTIKELFETGFLEGCPVYYQGGKVTLLRGRIRGIGILCSCALCQGCKVIPPSLFEIHARNSYKRAAEYIHVENGRSLIQILKACRTARLSTLEETLQNAIGPLSEKKLIVCQNCKESFHTLDTESSEAVCSACVMSNTSPIGPVFSYRKLCRSSKVRPFTPSKKTSACDVLPIRIQDKSIEKSSSSICPLKPSEAAPAGDVVPGKTRGKKFKKSPKASFSPKVRSSPRFGKSSAVNTSQKLTKFPQEMFMAAKTCSTGSMGKPSDSCKKALKRSFKASPKLSSSTRVGNSVLANDSGKTRKGNSASANGPENVTKVNISSTNDSGKTVKRLREEVLSPKSSKTPSVRSSLEKKSSGKITKKDLRLHKLVFEEDVLPDGTELGYYARGQKLLDGYKKGSGIFCSCCDTVVSASTFEAHAGCATRRKPYCYIYTSNGVSLHELSIKLIQNRTHSTKFNDDLCSICADGGDLLLCDGCPRAFHVECASLSSIPQGKWYCNYCQNMFEREKFVAHNANALAAGRVSGIDPIEQITTRSIRIVTNLASELSSCILCRGYDFCKSGFGPRTIILCDQCEKEYHVGCLKDHNIANLTELPEGKWFCSTDCGNIESALQDLLVRGAEKIPESLVSTIRRKQVEKASECSSDFDVSWRLLSGKMASPETRPLLSQAVAIFHESFTPIIDAVSGQDLIPAMVFGRNVAGQEYGGMYCAVLTINSVVVSAGIFRVFGPGVAELPLVATSAGNHGKGYFQALFSCIENLLSSLHVKSFVLPSAEEAESIWTDRFGFAKMTPDQVRELKRNYWLLLRFQGTSMLHKSVPENRIDETQP